jgi:hypothetical protein
MRSLLYFCGRVFATRLIGLPVFEVCMQSVFVCAGAIIAIVPLNHIGHIAGAFWIVACSTLFALAKRSEFIDEVFTSFIDFFRKPKGVLRVFGRS